MFKKDVIKFFGKSKDVCAVLELSSGSVSQWGAVIPEKQALRLEKLTNGALQYDSSLYAKKKSMKKD